MGCTIGAVRRQDGALMVFKNRDLSKQKENPTPSIKNGKKYRYIAFGVDIENKMPGVWAGVNEKGLAIAGADGNSLRDFAGEQYGAGEKTWEAYEEVLSRTRSVMDACIFLMDFYSVNRIGGSGDIILIADPSRVVAVEYVLNTWGMEFLDEHPFIVRTNFFNVLRHLRPAPEESSVHMSSAVRYERALDILSQTYKYTTLDDTKQLCRDHSRGQTAFSICRHGGEGEYQTVYSTIIEILPGVVKAHFIANNFPCQAEYQVLELQRH